MMARAMGLLTLMSVGLACEGEPFTIDWFTLDGGGENEKTGDLARGGLLGRITPHTTRSGAAYPIWDMHVRTAKNHAYVPEVRGVLYGTHYSEAHRQILVETGILNPDFTSNEATAAMMGWTLRDPEPEDLMAVTAVATAQPAEESEVNGASK
ncbi:MAG: hypothetical protein O7F17_06930 [Planctomycetota bacterium]|nr:hypothetical protein [Planctomycetota bacterium]